MASDSATLPSVVAATELIDAKLAELAPSTGRTIVEVSEVRDVLLDIRDALAFEFVPAKART